ncbi:MAG: efflux transporter periplasmic adaptor subunit [Sphingomonas sanxanigenens]|uniref:Efflux transporter periplasmic adaptor subunit n=1 Tax=Sphingomonas sanxanigenens TaxID=397260 RepID=A0A2W5AC46_9SPHN|nr:MAG: efflux transporter periplasmic adaptor subunit [Sphingomonas sanxanigenens]
MNRFAAALTRSAATIVIVTLAIVVAVWMWKHYERSPWTRDGRVRADVVRVTPDIGGLVTTVAVQDNQPVKAGQLLFVIDRPRYELALAQAEAQVASARATLGQARREAKRDLALGNLVAAEAHEQNVARVATAEAALDVALNARDTAALNVRRTNVVASVNGVVTNLDLHPGDYLAPGTQAMALIDTDSLRIEGYFEETKLPLICIGAPVTVKLMGEQRLLKGRVDTIAFGINDATRSDSGNLLPTVDPTFSWVRLAQRIPVRVKLSDVPADIRLIAGRTATVTVEPADAKTQKLGSCHHD